MICERAARAFCSEDPALIENYSAAAADKDEIWDIHHRAEILPCGNYSRAVLKKYQLYYNRPAAELIFLTHSEHTRLHKLGKKHSAATKKKMSAAKLGKKLSAATKKKMSIAKIGEKNPLFGKKLSAAARKKMSLAKIGRRYWNNGVKSVCAKTCPPGFAPGRCLRRS